MRLAIGLLALAWSVAIVPPSAMSEGMDPVLVGGDELSDACPSLGRVIGLDPKGDGFLSVRDGPAARMRERDRLEPGASVTICDERGPWLGVVYSPKGASVDCDVSSPRPARAPYDGPCRSGWVHSRFIEIVAG
ncbi:integron [Aureimonas psammosilenae]|uniref:integron n=1 Tax=Aureimonas psammosilenae TaxID=2495496 RepID=UPI001260BF77|nr:integron [Aureimonas psammosilenae]